MVVFHPYSSFGCTQTFEIDSLATRMAILRMCTQIKVQQFFYLEVLVYPKRIDNFEKKNDFEISEKGAYLVNLQSYRTAVDISRIFSTFSEPAKKCF